MFSHCLELKSPCQFKRACQPITADLNVFKVLPWIKNQSRTGLFYLTKFEKTVSYFSNCTQVNLHWPQCNDSWKNKKTKQETIFYCEALNKCDPSEEKKMQVDTAFAWLEQGNQVTTKVSSFISSEEWIPHCKIPLIPIPAVSSPRNIKAWHI